jgi:hypothetical protein
MALLRRSPCHPMKNGTAFFRAADDDLIQMPLIRRRLKFNDRAK